MEWERGVMDCHAGLVRLPGHSKFENETTDTKIKKSEKVLQNTSIFCC